MADITQLLDKARALGDALAAHDVPRAYHAAQQAARRDSGAQTLMRDYHAQINHIRDMEAQQRPIEVADKQKLKDLEQRMATSDVLRQLMRAQADYVALMNQVNEVMEAPLLALAEGLPSK